MMFPETALVLQLINQNEKTEIPVSLDVEGQASMQNKVDVNQQRWVT
jgi:hypothetical protein